MPASFLETLHGVSGGLFQYAHRSVASNYRTGFMYAQFHGTFPLTQCRYRGMYRSNQSPPTAPRPRAFWGSPKVCSIPQSSQHRLYAYRSSLIFRSTNCVWYTTHKGNYIPFIKPLTSTQIQAISKWSNKAKVDLIVGKFASIFVYFNGRLDFSGSESNLGTAQHPA